ncbi:MAG: tyrosine--tRNA ligase [Myxococcota bacterium]|nr:tyrosine--tRNA ligase [Myxococcota bacterium]MDW8362307.1 tyrosine--tRNA ligase [Myxococcales bacterium]
MTAPPSRATADEQLALLTRGVVDVHVEAELRERLAEGRPLLVKAGFDPTRPDLHLGHVVLLRKMRQFQDLGHEVVFVVGDFTARIGDPTGRNATRPVPTREQIEEGARTYAEQAFRVLDPARTRIEFNGRWLDAMRFDDVVRLAGRYTLARMMERDDFRRRWQAHDRIGLHELLYPLAQAYDSVVLRCDVELGGTDQLFNLLVGREIMKEYGLRPQIVMTTPILEGTDARWRDGRLVGEKMSKSLDNWIGVVEPPLEQFGKLMSIGDELMWRYYELLSSRPLDEVAQRRAACAEGRLNPRDAKLDLAHELVACFHGRSAADAAREAWIAQFSRREVPEQLPEREVRAGEGDRIRLVTALAEAGVLPSTSEARRRVRAGAVQVDGLRVMDEHATLERGRRYVIRAGKRDWVALTVR